MKHIRLIKGKLTLSVGLIFISLPEVGISQNLVPNPSAECTNSCPTQLSEQQAYWMDSPTFWSNPTIGSSDYFNACATGNVGIPINFFGNQLPRTGEGYLGFYVYHTMPDLLNYREYIQAKLTRPLEAGQCYEVSFYICLTENSVYAIDEIGAYFSVNQASATNVNALQVAPQIKSVNGLLLDDENDWTAITGTFTAQGGEEYITIGSFNNDDDTDTLNVGPPLTGYWPFSYYFADDICVVKCGEQCDQMTSADTTFGACSNNSIILTSNPNGNEYLWSTGESTEAIQVNPSADTTYWVIVADTISCLSSQNTFTIHIDSLLPKVLSTDTTMCEGTSMLLSASGGTSYQWSTSETTNSIFVNPLTSTGYNVTASNNCDTISEDIWVTVNPAPSVEAWSEHTILEWGQSTDFHATGGIYYLWSPSTGLSDSNAQNPTFTPSLTGSQSPITYYVVVTNAQGCKGIDSVIIYVEKVNINFFIPNAFSPNGDGYNDQLHFFGEGIYSYSLEVFNRWGEQVYSSSDFTEAWDGMYRGKQVNEAVFAYTLKISDFPGNSYLYYGNITVVR